MQISIFTYQKSSQILRESLCIMGKIEKCLQCPSNTPKYTNSVAYWMHNNLLFYIPFWIKAIIKIFRTIYLACAVLFPSVFSEDISTFFLVAVGIVSLGFTKVKNAPEGAKRVNFQL